MINGADNNGHTFYNNHNYILQKSVCPYIPCKISQPKKWNSMKGICRLRRDAKPVISLHWFYKVIWAEINYHAQTIQRKIRVYIFPQVIDCRVFAGFGYPSQVIFKFSHQIYCDLYGKAIQYKLKSGLFIRIFHFDLWYQWLCRSWNSQQIIPPEA